jgi:hypothetical protein
MNKIIKLIDSIFPLTSNFDSNKNKILLLKNEIRKLNNKQQIGGQKMTDSTIGELVSLREKGLLTEFELIQKLKMISNTNMPQLQKTESVNYKKRKKIRNHVAWTAEEDRKLIEMKQNEYSWKQMADELDRTKAAIRTRVSQLKHNKVHRTSGSNTNKKWEKNEDDYVKMMYHKIPVQDIANSLNRTYEAVRTRAKTLGVHRHQKKDTVQVGYNEYPKKYSMGP